MGRGRVVRGIVEREGPKERRVIDIGGGGGLGGWRREGEKESY